MLGEALSFKMNCYFPTPYSVSTTSISIRVSVSPLDTHDVSSKKVKDSTLVHLPKDGVKIVGRFWKKNVSVSVEAEKTSGSVDELGKQECRKNGLYPESEDEVKNGRGKVMHTRCSMKWASYGGCIPLMLEALENVSDLDEAFRPWECRISNKERSIILKEQVRWERAMEIFEWFKKKGCYELNVIHYNIMIRILGKSRKWDEVERLWDEMMVKKIVPINSTYGTLIDVYSKGGLNREASIWLERMNKQGIEPDEVTMGIVMQMYKKMGEFKKAEEYFKIWSAHKPVQGKKNVVVKKTGDHTRLSLSLYTYNTLIDTYGKSGRIQEMADTFQNMLKDGVVPDTITFNTMIHTYGNMGMIDEVNSLVKKMEELKRSPDTRTYNILIFLYAKRDKINLAFSYFTKMKEAGLEPDPVSYRTLLYAFSIRHMVKKTESLVSEMDERRLEIDEFTQSSLTRMYIDAAMIDKSYLWFERFHLRGNMSSECYSANIDAYGERGYVNEAEKVFICCLKKNKIGVVEFNVMIKAYGIGMKYDKACQLFDSMEKKGVHPDRCSYISLIQSLGAADLPHIAKPYLLKMQEKGLVNDCVPYSALISSFAKLGQLESAQSLYKKMISYNVKPDVVLYGVLINAFAESGNVTEAITCVEDLKNAGLLLNEVICSCLIKLYTKIGYLNNAQETYGLLQSFEKGADVFSSNCMIDLYSERLMVQEAEVIFEDLKKRSEANEFSYAMMLCMYKRIGNLEEAIKIAEKMQKLGLLRELLTYNSVIALYALDGKSKEAVNMFREMIRVKLEPDESTFKSLGLVLVKCGVPKQAVGKLEVLRKKEAENGVKAWLSALSSVVCGSSYGDYDDN